MNNNSGLGLVYFCVGVVLGIIIGTITTVSVVYFEEKDESTEVICKIQCEH